MTARRQQLKNDRGQTMTEFALVLPLLVVLLFGVLQFGIAFNNYVALTDAVRAAARKGAVSRELSDPKGTCESAGRAAAADLKPASLNMSCSSSWSPGSDVTVTGTYPYSVSLLGWVVKSGNLTTQIKERVE